MLSSREKSREKVNAFVIPKKPKAAVCVVGDAAEFLQAVAVPSREFDRDILPLIRASSTPNFLDQIAVQSCSLVNNPALTETFNAARRQLKEQANAGHGFLTVYSEAEAKQVCQQGLLVGNSVEAPLGLADKGVYVSQRFDLSDPSPPAVHCRRRTIIFKLLKGRVKSVGVGSSNLEPTYDFGCHVGRAERASDSRRDAYQRSLVYMYELDGLQTAAAPPTVCPYAVVEWKYETAPGRKLACSTDCWKGRLKFGAVHLEARLSSLFLRPKVAFLPRHVEVDAFFPAADVLQCSLMAPLLSAPADAFGQLCRRRDYRLRRDRNEWASYWRFYATPQSLAAMRRLVDDMRGAAVVAAFAIVAEEAAPATCFIFPTSEFSSAVGIPPEFDAPFLHAIVVSQRPPTATGQFDAHDGLDARDWQQHSPGALVHFDSPKVADMFAVMHSLRLTERHVPIAETLPQPAVAGDVPAYDTTAAFRNALQASAGASSSEPTTQLRVSVPIADEVTNDAQFSPIETGSTHGDSTADRPLRSILKRLPTAVERVDRLPSTSARPSLSQPPRKRWKVLQNRKNRLAGPPGLTLPGVGRGAEPTEADASLESCATTSGDSPTKHDSDSSGCVIVGESEAARLDDSGADADSDVTVIDEAPQSPTADVGAPASPPAAPRIVPLDAQSPLTVQPAASSSVSSREQAPRVAANAAQRVAARAKSEKWPINKYLDELRKMSESRAAADGCAEEEGEAPMEVDSDESPASPPPPIRQPTVQEAVISSTTAVTEASESAARDVDLRAEFGQIGAALTGSWRSPFSAAARNVPLAKTAASLAGSRLDCTAEVAANSTCSDAAAAAETDSPVESGEVEQCHAGVLVPDDLVLKRANAVDMLRILETFDGWRRHGWAAWTLKLHSQVVVGLAKTRASLDASSEAAERLRAITDALCRFRGAGVVELLAPHDCDEKTRTPLEYLPCVSRLARQVGHDTYTVFLSNMSAASPSAALFTDAGVRVMNVADFMSTFFDFSAS